MQAIGDIISYFFSYYFIVTLKSAQKSNWGKIYDIFSPSVLIFSPLGHAIIFLLSQTVYWGENIARRKSNHIFPAEHNLFLWQYLSWVFQLGENIWYFFPLCLYFCPCVFIFSPCVFIFSLLGHAINCSTFAGGVLGENILCLCFSPWSCCMVFILPFFLDSFLDMSLRRNNIIFSPLVQFFSYLWQKNL